MSEDNYFAMPLDDFGGPPQQDPYAATGDFTGGMAGGEYQQQMDPSAVAYLGDVQDMPPPASSGFMMMDDSAGGGTISDTPILLGMPPPPSVPSEEMDPAQQTQQQTHHRTVSNDSFDGDYIAPVVDGIEPSPMQKWNTEWQNTLLQRKEEENNKKAELLEAARIDWENFQQERERKREARMRKNREEEQVKLEAIEADLENDNSWQRVAKLVDLSQDNKSITDTKRMRDLLIMLKNETIKAQSLIN